MKQKYYVLLILILLGITACYATNYNKLHKKNKQIKKEHQNFITTINEIDNLLFSRYTLSDVSIKEDAILTNADGVTYKFCELVNNSPKVIFRYYSHSCNSCNKMEIEILKDFEKKIGSKNIFILTDFDEFRKNKVLIPKNNSDIQIFSVSNKELGLKKDFQHSFVFITNSYNKMILPYTPIYFLDENMVRYHEFIYKKYFYEE